MSLLGELRRRNVFRASAAYVAVAWLLIQVAETTFPAFGFSDAALRNLIIILGIGLIPAVALSWAFELTPEGFKRERDVVAGSELSRRTNRLLDRLIMVVLALGLAYFAVDKFIFDPARDRARETEIAEKARSEAMLESFGDKSIAVMPFIDLSPDGDQDYIAAGVAEEIINLLSSVADLRVIARSSSFAFKEQNLPASQVAERLNVNYVMDGSVRRSGDQLRITAQIIDARRDTQLWSQKFDRPFGDIFAIEDEIAQTVVQQLRATLQGGPPQVATADPQAYALLLQARYALNQGTPEQIDEAERLARESLQIDPTQVPALTLLMEVYFQRGLRRIDTRRSIGQGREVAQRVLELDPVNAFARMRMARSEPDALYDWGADAKAIKLGLSLDPRALEILKDAAQYSDELGLHEQSVALYDYILKRDPLCAPCLAFQARALKALGRYEEAIDTLNRARALGLLGMRGEREIGFIRLLQGDAEAALAISDEYARLSGQPERILRPLALFSLGRTAEFEAAFADLRETFGARFPGALAQVYAWSGQPDEAFAQLRKSINPANFQWGPAGVNGDPIFAGLHDDPRWLEILELRGTSPSQVAAMDFKVAVPRN